MKPSARANLTKRLIWGSLIAVVIVGVVAWKLITKEPGAVTLVTEATPAATPTAARPQGLPAPTLGPAAPTATQGATGQDPFPASPAAQVQWVARNKKPAILLYHSTNCIPCKEMERLVKEVRADYEPDVVFVDVVTNDQANAAEIRRSGIQYIPTTFFVSSSGKSEQIVGAMKEEALRAKLASLKAGR